MSPVLNESRLMKICASTIKLGLIDQITVLGFWQEGLEVHENLGEGINLIRIKTISKTSPSKNWLLRKLYALFSLWQYYRACYRYCKQQRPQFISCHNLILLPISAIIKNKTGCIFLYEPHELETERTGMGGMEKTVSKFIERRYIYSADKIVTVCDPISKIYKKLYDLSDAKVVSIQNAPVNPDFGKEVKRYNLLREEFNIPAGAIIFIYQGVLSRFRGIQSYLDCFSRLDESKHTVLMGYGEDESLIKQYSRQYKNIHFKPAVPVKDIIKYTSSADVGLFFIPGYDISLSYQYCLPNKFFEYAIAGLHICVSDNFELLSKIVKEDNLGTVISAEGESLFKWINSIESREEVVPDQKSYSKRINYGWQNEEIKFIDIYSIV